jgi:hypothetical protein
MRSAATSLRTAPTRCAAYSHAAGYRPNHAGLLDAQGASRQYMRDMILGVNDGLVSTFLLAFGVAGGNFSNRDILLTVITGVVAGAISMALGEFLATKSQASARRQPARPDHARGRPLSHARDCALERGVRG